MTRDGGLQDISPTPAAVRSGRRASRRPSCPDRRTGPDHRWFSIRVFGGAASGGTSRIPPAWMPGHGAEARVRSTSSPVPLGSSPASVQARITPPPASTAAARRARRPGAWSRRWRRQLCRAGAGGLQVRGVGAGGVQECGVGAGGARTRPRSRATVRSVSRRWIPVSRLRQASTILVVARSAGQLGEDHGSGHDLARRPASSVECGPILPFTS